MPTTKTSPQQFSEATGYSKIFKLQSSIRFENELATRQATNKSVSNDGGLPYLTLLFLSLYKPADELIQVFTIRKSLKMCTVGVPPGTGLRNTAFV